MPVGRDGDFSWERMQKLYDSKLRNDLGNLLNRVIVLLKKDEGTINVTGSLTPLGDSWSQYEKAMNDFELSQAIEVACRLASDCNRFIDEKKPWSLSDAERKETLSVLAENIRHIALMLLPFTPETAQKISRQLNVHYADQMLDKDFVIGDKKDWGLQKDWKHIGEPKILFSPLDEK